MGAPGTGEKIDWHALPAAEALSRLQSAEQGLSPDEAESRLRSVGPNHLPQPLGSGVGRRVARQFQNLLIYVLLVAALLAMALDHALDAVVILAVVVVNAVIGFVQEGRAERALEAIRGMIDPQATVLRDGRRQRVPAACVVPGDLVLVAAGDRVPADLRLVRARNLRIEEAILTGESVAVEKDPQELPREAELGDRSCMAYSGTLVSGGQGAGVAVATGEHTELGRISQLMRSVTSLKTPLLRQMHRFAQRLTAFILGLSALTFFVALGLRDYPLAEAFMAVVGLTVAAIPEGLPAILTISLAIGVQRMAGRNAIIRRLPAVETLGSVAVICSDKTGTLTRNEMTAQSLVAGDCRYDVDGVGYEPRGAFRSDDGEIDPGQSPVLMELLRTGVLCNDAELREREGSWQADGDPMEAALVTLAMKAGLDVGRLRRELPRSDEIPFDPAHRVMATLHHSHADESFVLLKGAPERILEMCCEQRGGGEVRTLDRAAWERTAEELAARGQRVLAFATKRLAPRQQNLTFDDVESGATLLGLVGFIDPPRAEAIRAVADCRAAGIRVVMITGDHAVTAREIARQLGIDEEPRVLTGGELEDLDEAALDEAARETTVFARTTPEHKLRLVKALQRQGLAVAMTDDGVNDAPALKRADVGVAMGCKGSEAAKEAAEIVLADDNFASIVAAVREGRTVHDNLMKVIAWTLPTNGGEALTILAAIAFGLALPITPVQILWINMITAVALGLTLAFEPTEAGTMRRPPRPLGQPILGGHLLWRVAFVSVLFVAGAFGMFYWGEARGLTLETSRTLVVNTLVVMEIFYLFSVRYTHGSALTWRAVLGTRALLIGIVTVTLAQFALTYAPPLQAVFETRPVAFLDGLLIVVAGIAMLLVVEAEKWLSRKMAG